MKKLKVRYKDSLVLTGVFPNKLSSKESIDEFSEKFDFNFDRIIIDSNLTLVNKFKATITPQVFLTDSCNKVFYNGRIDDQYIAIGKRKRKTSTNDLEDAIFAILRNKNIKIEETQPIGCFITK